MPSPRWAFGILLHIFFSKNTLSAGLDDASDDSCTLLPGLCDDNSHTQAFQSQAASVNNTRMSLALQEAHATVNGRFFCYKTGEGNFLAYDPPAPDVSRVVNTQLPDSVKQLQEDWMASSFQFGEPCKAESSAKDCPQGFTVDTAGIAVVNDAGNMYGGGSSAAPPHCGGCQEEVLVCLSSARSVRQGCSVVPLSPHATKEHELQHSSHMHVSHAEGSCGLASYQHAWILRNRNLYSHNIQKGTGKYFYMMTIQGMPCNAQRDAKAIQNLIKSFAQGFQGMIDIWRVKPACDGKCEIMSGAVSAWMTYSIPVAVSILAQLRAWASLKIDNMPGCIGNQAVLKFGSVSVTDHGVVCCPEPHSGGRCNQNYLLPDGWNTKLKEGSDWDFSQWLASKLGNGVGSCPHCGWPGPDPHGTMCPGAAFSYDDARCVAHDYTNYVPGGGGPTPSPPAPSPPSPPAPRLDQIVLKADNWRCIDLKSEDTTNGNTIEVWTCNGLENQQWILSPGSWHITYRADPTKCIDAGDMSNGKQLQIWDCNDLPQQSWGYDAHAGTVYLAHSTLDASKCMDLAGGSKSDGTKIQVWDCNGKWEQQWYPPVGGISILQSESKKCLDLAGGDTSNGNKVWLWSCNGHYNQRWFFNNGEWKITFVADHTKCLDAGDMSAGSTLKIWDCNGQKQQTFGYDSNTQTIYLAKSASDATMCVDLAGANSQDGSGIQIWPCNGKWNQHWSMFYQSATAKLDSDLAVKAAPPVTFSNSSSELTAVVTTMI